MQPVQIGLACGWLALHLRRVYFTRIGGGKSLPSCAVFERTTAMAAYETSRAAPFGAITVYRMVQSVGRTVEALKAWNSARITRKSLNRLSNRELDDIGLWRGDIELIGR
jgi:uncharacterized protein YjiS (DUF1127 family)